MRILIACEFSGIVRDSFIKAGHDAVSCDLLPSEKSGPHIQDDVMNHLTGWDAIIGFPPCTDLAYVNAGLLHEKIKDGRTQKAIDFVDAIWNSCDIVCIENPKSILNKMWKPYSQIIEPYFFGHSYLKKTCLWLKNLPPLISTCYATPTHSWVNSGGKKSKFKGIHNYGKNRSRFHQGIADAMANQWLTN